MRLPLVTLEIFETIAQEGSLRGAAKRLGLQPSTVSHQLKNLESQLGVTLFSRTTRSVTLTEAGQMLFQGTRPAFDQIRGALQAARDTGRSRRGSLRITMPGFAYEIAISKKLARFRELYPDIELEININETFVDLFKERFHAGIRLEDRIDPDMIAVRITPPLAIGVLASEAYLAKYGKPESPEDLVKHECIRYRFGQSGAFAPWEFVGNNGRYQVQVGGNLIVNSLPSLYAAIADGIGLGYSFADYRPAGTAGGVVSLLQDFTEPIAGTYLYYPREYRSVALLRLFVEHYRLRAED